MTTPHTRELPREPISPEPAGWRPLSTSGRDACARVALVDGMAGLAAAIARAELASSQRDRVAASLRYVVEPSRTAREARRAGY